MELKPENIQELQQRKKLLIVLNGIETRTLIHLSIIFHLSFNRTKWN